jgi:hypothetical protein
MIIHPAGSCQRDTLPQSGSSIDDGSKAGEIQDISDQLCHKREITKIQGRRTNMCKLRRKFATWS